MKLMIFDYECENGHRTEMLRLPIERDKPVACHCGKMLEYRYSMPHIKLDGCSGDFPTESDKWVKRREQKIRQERKQKYS